MQFPYQEKPLEMKKSKKCKKLCGYFCKENILKKFSKQIGLEPVLGNFKKSCIISYYGQFSTNKKIKKT